MSKIDIKQLMKQAKAMQDEMQKKQTEFAAKVFEASSGGGMVTAKINGDRRIMSLKIDPSVISSNDAGMLEDLVVAAVNEAINVADEAMKDSLSNIL